MQTQALEAKGQRASGERKPIFGLEKVGVAYGGVPAVRDVDFPIYENQITALIGPSGCGKSTLIRCLNRMNDLIPARSREGKVNYHGQDLYGPNIDPVQVRKRIGMVFQKPNPFPKIDLRQHRLRAPRLGHQGRHGRDRRARLRRGRPVGRGEGPAEDRTPSACPAASSSGCASPAPWPPSPT